jgi:hypothetical protein
MKRHELWTELETQKVLLLDQQKRVYQQYRMLLDAVHTGQIADWQEVLELLFELVEFSDHYAPAWELRAELALHIRQHFPQQVENGAALLQILL